MTMDAYKEALNETLIADQQRRERDNMAGLALRGMLAHPTRYKPRVGAPENWHDAIAQEAYEIADAMLRAHNEVPE
jgi:hypothetical protein